jgi:hypothetical protein
VVDGCFRDPDLVGCLKGAVEVGAWFVPGGAAARGTELALAGGAHFLEDGVAAEARAATEDAAASCRNSFAGMTPVLMADGTMRPIEDVKVGDKVRNAEPDSSRTEIHTVTALHITDTDRDFVDVTISTSGGPEKITSTAHHLWWDVTTRSWTDATKLAPGDLLDTPGDGRATIESLNRYTSSFRTYNLTIDTTHTYYVLAGAVSVLVHNCGVDKLSQNIADHANGDALRPDGDGTHFVRGVDPKALSHYVDGVVNERVPDLEIRYLNKGRVGYWDPDKAAVVIEDDGSGTVFTPKGGKSYFDGLK